MTPIAEKVLLDRTELFETEHLKADLKGRSIRGGAATVLGQGASFVIQTGATVVLARLLTPQDYGMIAMITAVTGFVTLFKDLGLSMATVQTDTITHEQVSTLFWVNVALSAVVMLVAMALAPAIAWFYGEPKLLPLTLVMAVGFIFGGLCVQHSALLRRQMRFGSLALIDILQLAVSAVVGIGTALAGAGVWALVYMTLSGSLFNAVAVWVASPWWPGLPVRHANVRGMLAFGANLTGFNALNYFARNLDSILIGRVWGGAALGFYTKAYGLLLLPLQRITAPVRAVAIPTLSRLQSEPERYRRYFLRAVNSVAVVTVPIVCILGVFAPQLIDILLGPQWSSVAVIFRVLAAAAIIEPVTEGAYWLLISTGQTRRLLYWRLITVPLLALSFLLGLPWGALGVATMYTACSLLLFLPCLAYGSKHSPVRVTSFLAAIHRPFIWGGALLGAGFLGSAAARGIGIWPSFGSFAAMTGVGTVILLRWPQARGEIGDCLGILQELRCAR
jgi:PST family polysaccharide transporter